MEKTFSEIKTKVDRRILEEPLATEPLKSYNNYFSGNWIQLNLNIEWLFALFFSWGTELAEDTELNKIQLHLRAAQILMHISSIPRAQSNTHHNMSCAMDIWKAEKVIFTRIIIWTSTKWGTNDLRDADYVGLED